MARAASAITFVRPNKKGVPVDRHPFLGCSLNEEAKSPAGFAAPEPALD